jgi:hypothetical protein
LENPNKSNLYLALAGITPFDGSQLNRMPDIQADANGRYAQPDELQMVATWITNRMGPNIFESELQGHKIVLDIRAG